MCVDVCVCYVAVCVNAWMCVCCVVNLCLFFCVDVGVVFMTCVCVFMVCVCVWWCVCVFIRVDVCVLVLLCCTMLCCVCCV